MRLRSPYSPQGDQAQAIAKLSRSLHAGNRHQTLLGVTGSGKTFTVANLIADLARPTLVMSHNKTLAAQLYSEFKAFFPDNAVEYFVSYFDYYQPEAYIPRTDTYIEKDSSINDEIERLRLSTMGSLLTRQDTIVIASVSCIYGLGSPEDYAGMMLPVRVGDIFDRDTFLRELVNLLYERNDVELSRGRFRARGDVVEAHPAYLENEAIRIEFFGDEIERISAIDPLTGTATASLQAYTFHPAKQFVTPREKMRKAIVSIREELAERVSWFERENKLLEAQRIKMRTEYDIEMMEEMGFCQGIENYSRHITGRPPGATPGTLLDFFPDDFFLVIDESHVSIPQIGGMYEGDRSRKLTLVEHGFRLPSALDNRPLRFEEFMARTRQTLYVSATPARFEIENSVVGNTSFIPPRQKGRAAAPAPPLVPRISGSAQPVEDFDVTTPGRPLVVEQIIRPTGLLDPTIELRPLKGQIDATIAACRERAQAGQRVLVTTLTKRTAETLTDYLVDLGLRVRYLHADVDTVERVEILRGLRAGDFDILVGINLLREGLDLPEVSLVCILDADKEGFLRSETSLVQTAGRAARHVDGHVILFADSQTRSIDALLQISGYRRRAQAAHNERLGITPRSVLRPVQQSLHQTIAGDDKGAGRPTSNTLREEAPLDVATLIRELEEEMRDASAKLEFERAALLRDQILELKAHTSPDARRPDTPVSYRPSPTKNRAAKQPQKKRPRRPQ